MGAGSRPKRKPKRSGLMDAVRDHVEAGTVLYSVHALARCDERAIAVVEAEYVLKNGWHEKMKDQYDAMYEDIEPWKYSVRGKTVDGRELRIVATFVEEDGEQLLVVTAIDLDAER